MEMFSFMPGLLYYILAQSRSELYSEPYVQLRETQQLKPSEQNNIQPTTHPGT